MSTKNSSRVDEVINFVKKYGGLDYAEKIMNDYKNKAIKILLEFPENDSRASLIRLVEYTVSRKN